MSSSSNIGGENPSLDSGRYDSPLVPVIDSVHDESTAHEFAKSLVSQYHTLSKVEADDDVDSIKKGKIVARKRQVAQQHLTKSLANQAHGIALQKFVLVLRALQTSSELALTRQNPRLSFLLLLALQRSVKNGSPDALQDARDTASAFLTDVLSPSWEKNCFVRRQNNPSAIAQQQWAYLESDMRVAFRTATLFNVNILSCDVIPFVHRMWSTNTLKACCFVMSKIGWKDAFERVSFTKEEFCERLMMQGSDDIVEAILKDCCDHVRGPDQALPSIARQVIDQALALQLSNSTIAPSRSRSWEAFAYHLVKLFQVSHEYPDLVMRVQKQSVRRALLKSKIGPIVGTLRAYGNTELMEWVVTELTTTGQCALAKEVLAQLATYFPVENLQQAVAKFSPFTDGDSTHEANRLRLPFPIEKVVVVDRNGDSLTQFENWVKSAGGLLQGHEKVVGLDAEWKPTSRKKEVTKVSLLQISSIDQAFLLDLKTLFSPSDAVSDRVVSSLTALFKDEHIMKVGFGFKQDLMLLNRSYQDHCSCWEQISPFVDLASGSFRQELLRGSTGLSISSTDINTAGNGLKGVVKLVLHKNLSKSFQMSNWDLRPLTAGQIEYASLDAWCLVEVFNRVFVVGQQEVDFHAIAGRMRQMQRAPKPHHHGASTVQQDPVPTEVVKSTTQQRCSAANVDFEFVTTSEICGSTETAAKALGCDQSQVVKTLGFLFDAHEMLRTGLQSPAQEDHVAMCAPAGDVFSLLRTMHSQRDGKIPRWIPVAVLAAGSTSVDLQKLARACASLLHGHGSKQANYATKTRRCVRMANPKECVHFFGFVPGTMSPLGLRDFQHLPIPILIDESVGMNSKNGVEVDRDPNTYGKMFTGGGSLVDLIKFDSREALVEVTNAIPINLAKVMGEPANQDATKKYNNNEIPLKFFVDTGLGKITKWLRVLGFDAVSTGDFAYMNGLNRSGTIRAMLDEAESTRRLVVSGDRKLSGYKSNCAIFVIASRGNCKEQFEELCARFSIAYNASTFLTRCTSCNSPGFIPISRDDLLTKNELAAARDHVPAEVFENHEPTTQYWMCRNSECSKVYWEGNKFFAAHSRFETEFQYSSV